MTKNYAIINGSWTAEGNFSGYNAKGERIHVYGKQMENLGFKKGDAVSKLFAIAMPKQYSKVDDKGNEIAGTEFTRLTATAVFKTQEELASAHVADSALDLTVRKAIKAQATDAGLSEAEVADLLATL